MKKVIFISLLVLLAGMSVVYSYELQAVSVTFTDTLLVGDDTLWSKPAPIFSRNHAVTARTFKIHAWSNTGACTLSVYFKVLDKGDTLLMDSIAYSPWDAPGDSTVFVDWPVPTSAATYGGMVIPPVASYIRIGLFSKGAATDSIWFHSNTGGMFPVGTYVIMAVE